MGSGTPCVSAAMGGVGAPSAILQWESCGREAQRHLEPRWGDMGMPGGWGSGNAMHGSRHESLPPPPILSYEFKSYMVATYTGDEEDKTEYESTGEDMITVRGGGGGRGGTMRRIRPSVRGQSHHHETYASTHSHTCTSTPPHMCLSTHFRLATCGCLTLSKRTGGRW